MPILFALFHVTFLVSLAVHGQEVEKESRESQGFPDAVLVESSVKTDEVKR